MANITDSLKEVLLTSNSESIFALSSSDILSEYDCSLSDSSQPDPYSSGGASDSSQSDPYLLLWLSFSWKVCLVSSILIFLANSLTCCSGLPRSSVFCFFAKEAVESSSS